MALTVRTLPPSEYGAWEQFLRGSPDGNVYASTAYLDLLCTATGGSFSVAAVLKGDDVVGGVGVYEERGRGGAYVTPRLLLYYNGVIARRIDSRYEATRASDMLGITGALAAHFDAAPLGRVTLRAPATFSDARAFLSRGWSAFPSYSYVVPLTEPDAMWGRVDQNLRRLVRRAEESGVTFAVDHDFDGFWPLHAETMERKGQPPYLPEARFRSFARALVDRGLATFMHARLPDGGAAASILVLLGGFPVAHTVCSAGDEAQQRLGVNPFLRWRSLLWLQERGYAGNDLTDAALNPVTRFKSQLGGELTLSLNLDRPRTVRYAAGASVESGLRRLRGALGAAARRLGVRR